MRTMAQLPKRPALKIALFLALGATQALPAAAAEVIAHPKTLATLPYPRDASFNFPEGADYPIEHETESDLFFQVKDKTDYFLRIPKSAVTAERARRVDDRLRFLKDLRIESGQAYLLLKPGEGYPVLSSEAASLRIRYRIGETTMEVTLPRDLFEETLQRNFPVLKEPEDAICIIDFADGSAGSGFLLWIDDKLYCITNQHVVANTSRMEIRLMNGHRLKSKRMEFAAGADLARIEVEGSMPAFTVARRPKLDETIRVLGNSLGAGRVTSIKGRVTGLNRDEIETNAKFVSGNSGGPILSDANEVLGVATLIEHFPGYKAITEGTLFENGRRVGLRIDGDLEWLSVDHASFISRNRLFLLASQFLDELPVAYAHAVSADPKVRIPADTFRDSTLRQWVNDRNTRFDNLLRKYTALMEETSRSTNRSSIFMQKKAEIEQAFLDDIATEGKQIWAAMLQRIRSKQRVISSFTPYPDTDFLRTEIARMGKMFDQAETVARMIYDQFDRTN